MLSCLCSKLSSIKFSVTFRGDALLSFHLLCGLSLGTFSFSNIFKEKEGQKGAGKIVGRYITETCSKKKVSCVKLMYSKKARGSILLCEAENWATLEGDF